VKKRFWMIAVLALVLTAALLLPACAKTTPTTTSASTPATTTAPVEVKTIKISYSCPKGKGYSSGEEWFGPEFEKRTNGRYKVEVYGMSTLVPIDAVLDSVRSGVCQIGLTSTAQFAKDFPLSQLTITPTLGWPGADEAMYQASNEAWQEFSQIPEVAAELNNGFTFLTNDILNASNLVMTSKAVHTPADFKGTKIGAVGAIADLVTANGGAAVAVIGPDNYEALDKGVIDGGVMSMTMATDWKVHTIADYFYMFDFGCSNMLVLMNTDFWNSMSPEDQKIFNDVRQEAFRVLIDFEMNSYKEAIDIMNAAGKTMTQPTAAEMTAWKKTVNEILIPKWRADAKSVGVSDATLDKVYNEWIRIRAKYWEKYNLPGEP